MSHLDPLASWNLQKRHGARDGSLSRRAIGSEHSNKGLPSGERLQRGEACAQRAVTWLVRTPKFGRAHQAMQVKALRSTVTKQRSATHRSSQRFSMLVRWKSNPRAARRLAA